MSQMMYIGKRCFWKIKSFAKDILKKGALVPPMILFNNFYDVAAETS